MSTSRALQKQALLQRAQALDGLRPGGQGWIFASCRSRHTAIYSLWALPYPKTRSNSPRSFCHGQWRGRANETLGFQSLDPALRQFGKEAAFVAGHESFEFRHIIRGFNAVPSPECGSDFLRW